MTKRIETPITNEQAKDLHKLVADMIEAYAHCQTVNDPYTLRRYQKQWVERAKATLQSIDNPPDDNFVWERAITLTPDETRVLRVVSKEYGMRMQRYYGDGAIAVRLGSQYDLIHYWDNPYANTTHFGLTKYGRELFSNKRFQAYCATLDEKAAAQPEMEQPKLPPSLNLTVNQRLLKKK